MKLRTCYQVSEVAASDEPALCDRPELAAGIVQGIILAEHLDATQEHFGILALNTRMKATGYRVLFSGARSHCDTDPAIIFRVALLLAEGLPSSIMLWHTHPSGDPSPSEDDITTTKRLQEAGKLIGIPVVDHLIIAGDRWVSLHARGQI